MDKPQEFWNKFLFTDESKFNIFGSDGRIKVWRKPWQGLDSRYTAKTVKHNGGGVMVWGCMAANGVGMIEFINGIMDQYVYMDVLRRNWKPSVKKLGLGRDYIYFIGIMIPNIQLKMLGCFIVQYVPLLENATTKSRYKSH